MLIPLRGWILLVVILIVAGSGYYNAFQDLSITRSADDQVRVQLAQRWAQKVASEVKQLPGRPLVAVADVVNDKNQILTNQLRTWIARRNVRLVDARWYHSVGSKLGMVKEPTSMEESVKPLLDKNLDFIIAAHIANWTTYPEYEARLAGTVQIIDGATGEIVSRYQLSLPEMIDVVSTERAKGRDIPQTGSKAPPGSFVDKNSLQESLRTLKEKENHHQATMSPLAGMTIWLATVLFLPLASSSPMKRLLRRRNNAVNGTMLISWVVATAFLALVLWGLQLPPALGLPVGIAAVLLATLYFGYCCHCLEKSA